MCDLQDKAESRPAGDAKSLLIVGGLLIVIIASLAALWQKERSRRGRAEETLVEMHVQYSRLQTAAAQMTLSAQAGRPVRRADLPAEEVTLNGQRRVALHLGADTGERMGFAPGDVILVSTRPAVTQPAR